MKWICGTALCIFCGFRGAAQSASQIKAEISQVAAYEVYIKDAEKGYEIVENGVNTIGEIKKGTFNLHSVFFSSLKAVSPAVKGFTEVAEIVALQISIVEAFSGALGTLKASGNLSGGDMAFITQVYNKIVSGTLEDVDALQTLITDGSVSMNDGERIRLIDGLYKDMSDKYSFSRSFLSGAVDLDQSKAAEASDIKGLKALYGIN